MGIIENKSYLLPFTCNMLSVEPVNTYQTHGYCSLICSTCDGMLIFFVMLGCLDELPSLFRRTGI